MSESHDVLVVGGGILGASLAFALARDGVDVALLEAGRIASATTTNTFAWLNATSKHADPDYHRLNAAGMARWRALAREFGDERVGLHASGNLVWCDARDDAERTRLARQYENLRELDYPVCWLEGASLAALEAHVDFGTHAAGLLTPSDAWLEGERAARLLADEARAHGASLHEGHAVRTIELSADGRVRGVRTEKGTLDAAVVVVAAGTECASLLARAGAHAPVTGVPGLLLETPDPGSRRWPHHVHYTNARGELHMRASAGGGMLLGAEDVDELLAGDDRESALREGAATLLARARAYLPGLPADLAPEHCTTRVGVRPMPADERPIVGPVPGVPGLHVMVTHSGITLGALLGELLAAEIRRGAPGDLLAPYRLERFAAPD